MLKYVVLASLCVALVVAQMQQGGGPPQGPPQGPPGGQQGPPGGPPGGSNMLHRVARQMPGGMPDPANMPAMGIDMMNNAMHSMGDIPSAMASIPVGMMDAGRQMAHKMIGDRRRRAAPQMNMQESTPSEVY